MTTIQTAVKRRNFIDTAKGIAILLLLFSHTMSASEHVVGVWICSFHMPIFFIISGMLTGRRYAPGEKPDITVLLKKRAFQIGVPYLVFSMALAAFYTALQVASGSDIQLPSYLFRIVSMQGIDSLWFLPAFFFSELLLALVLHRRSPIYLLGGSILAIMLLLGIQSTHMPECWLLRVLLRVLIGYSFMAIGCLMAWGDILEKLSWPVLIVLFAMGTALSQVNGFSAIGSLQVNHVMLFYFDATAISTAILGTAKMFDDRQTDFSVLRTFGKNSIVVLCTNNLLIEIIRLLDYKLTGDVLLRWGMWGCLLFTGILVLIEYGLIRLSHTHLGVIFGKKNTAR